MITIASEDTFKNETIMDFVNNLRKDQIKKSKKKYVDSFLTDRTIEKNTLKLFELVNITNKSTEPKHH